MRSYIYKLAVLICLICMSSNFILKAQNAAKLKQQKTTFFYTQLNLHGGWMQDPYGTRLDLPLRGPENQVAFQLLNVNQKQIQRGYTPLIAIAGWKARASLGYSKWTDRKGIKKGFGQIKLRDLWMKFNTKWDRTNFWVGYKSIPFGHNPKLDPVVSFMTNIVSSDLGIGQDMGIFIKTPFSTKLDLEMSLTTGGMFSRSLLSYGNLIDNSTWSDPNPEFSAINLSYQGTWLVTGRLGKQPFKKNELGLIGVAGRVPCFFIPGEYISMAHIGGDWVLKHREMLRMTNQLVLGYNKTMAEGQYLDIGMQNNLDLFFFGKSIVSLSHSLNVNRGLGENDRVFFNSTTANSLTYVVSPHTRIRLNQFLTMANYSKNTSWGLSLQFVTGIGKR